MQNAVIISKVARLDYPLDWPNVFSELVTIIRMFSEDVPTDLAELGSNLQHQELILKLSRALQILLHIIKEQATGRLPLARTNLKTITSEIFKILGGVYLKFVHVWATSSTESPPVAELMNLTLTCLKIQRRLMVHGYEFPNRVEEVKEFWQIIQTHLAPFLRLTEGPSQFAEAARKHAKSLGKLFLNVSSSHGFSFALMPDTLPLVRNYWSLVVDHGERLAQSKPLTGGKRKASTTNGTNGVVDGAAEEEDEGLQQFREKVALQGMVLLRGCIRLVFNPTAASTTSYLKCTFSPGIWRVLLNQGS